MPKGGFYEGPDDEIHGGCVVVIIIVAIAAIIAAILC